MVCIGGGISGQGEKILKPIRDMVKAERYSVYADKQTNIVPAELGNDAGIIGAAALVRSK
jgi:glucokinase